MTIRKRYKIKEFSEEMGVTVDLVKHYEKYGIINPIKEQDCKYRFYTIQHGERILASKRFRNMGFTIRDSAKIMNEYSLEEIQATLDNKAKDIEKEIIKLNSMNKRIIELKEQCELFKKCEDKIAIVISPGFYFLKQTENAEFDQDEITKERIKEWIEYFPFVTKALKVPKDYFTNEKSINYQWGLVIGEDTANNIADIMIYTKEYSNALWIPAKLCSRLDTDKLLAIEQGDKISFRIGTLEAEQLLNKAEFVNIVSLETDGTEILSLSDYNSVMHETSRPTKIAIVVVVIFFAGLALVFYKRSKQKSH